MSDRPPSSDVRHATEAERRLMRQAEALRANLIRRKAQLRARRADEVADAPTEPAPPAAQRHWSADTPEH